jgi:hypothetical protein
VIRLERVLRARPDRLATLPFCLHLASLEKSLPKTNAVNVMQREPDFSATASSWLRLTSLEKSSPKTNIDVTKAIAAAVRTSFFTYSHQCN